MAPNRGLNRARAFEKFASNGLIELDPEADDVQPFDSEDDSESSDTQDAQDAREHYVDVGKSKLRERKEVALGPQYRGSKIARDELDSEEDDPFGREFDDEVSEEEDDIEDGGSSAGRGSELEDADATSGTDLSDDASERPRLMPGQDAVKERMEKELQDLRQMQSRAQNAVTASISQANKDDAEKGRAVKRQRTTFDALLSTRMKMQKSLVATNTLVGTPQETLDVEKDRAQEALEAAESAAFNLWSSLNDMREDLISLRTGSKRKRSPFLITTPTSDLWSYAQAQGDESRSYYNNILRKWSNKAHLPPPVTQAGRLNRQDHTKATIVNALAEQLTDPTRLLARTHAPRSCAPLQVSQRVTYDPKIYDDADFYGVLLKELLEQKSHDSSAAANIDLGFQMRRENKTRKTVDTKASKGRKLRYTVHEKLQNFMAPEDRTTWGVRQAEELFGSLFGRRMALGEDLEEVEDDVVDEVEAGLLMFRN